MATARTLQVSSRAPWPAFLPLMWDNMLGQPGQIAGLVVGVVVNFAVFSLMPEARAVEA